LLTRSSNSECRPLSPFLKFIEVDLPLVDYLKGEKRNAVLARYKKHGFEIRGGKPVMFVNE
jgi:hypothetical protein